MEWPPRTGPLGPDPYPNPSSSLYPLESNLDQEYQYYPPPTNPPWALRSGFGTADTSTNPNEHGEVSLYPPPPNQFNQPLSEHHSPELSLDSLVQEYPPKASGVEPSSDSWKDLHSTTSSFDREPYPNWESQQKDADSGALYGGAIPPSLQFQPYPYPPSSVSETFLNNFSSPHTEHFPTSHFTSSPPPFPPSTSASAPPPPSDCPPVYPSASNSAPPWSAPGLVSTDIQGHTSSVPNLPGGPALSFGCKPASTHPLLQGVEDDFVPYVDGDDDSDSGEELKTGYGKAVDYSHEALEKYGTNLTTSAKEGSLDPVIGRDLVVRQCIEILTRKSKCNPVLVGHPGVGKTAVVEGLAQRIVKGNVPEPLRKCKIISVDVTNLVAGTDIRGQFEEKMKELIDEATKAKRKVILFLDELHRLLGAGKTRGCSDGASEIMKPALARGEFLCIGATTFDEYTKFIEKDQALARRFQKVVVDPPSPEDTISILRGLKPRLESHHRISIADDALIEAVKLSDRYIPDRFLPDKAIDLVDEAASKVKLELSSKPSILDEIDRAILQLDMDRLSVTAATGQSSQDRLQRILSDLEGLKLRQTNLNRKWKKEKAITTRIVSLKEEIALFDISLIWEDEIVDPDEVHVGFSCDPCQMCPIIGPRYRHATQNLDLCKNCHKAMLGDFGECGLLNDYHRMEVHPECGGCSQYPIVGNYYIIWQCTDHDELQTAYYIICQPCTRKAVTEFKAQLQTAENEWNEYQKSYKPLIQLEVSSIIIAEVLSTRTGIPVTKMQASQMQQLLQLDVELHKRVIGQDEACNAIARAIQRSRAGLSDPNRPIASFMFMGPTGVGKTELAKALATRLFNSENAMVRIDMSEYGDKFNISRLTGAAPGLIGHGDGGQLTTPVRRQPYSVVLFDEIEKANDDIFNVFLQILDDGRLTDSEGRLVNFTNTVIIMTSNVGAEKIIEVTANSSAYSSKDETYQVMKFQVMEAARAKYRPEFINRIDEFIVFQPLNPQQIFDIVKLQLERVSKRLEDRMITLRVSESALQLLSTMGYDPRYGARPVKRVIQQSIEDPLAQGILRGQYTDGCTIMVDTELSSLGPNSQQRQQKLTFHKLAQL